MTTRLELERLAVVSKFLNSDKAHLQVLTFKRLLLVSQKCKNRGKQIKVFDAYFYVVYFVEPSSIFQGYYLYYIDAIGRNSTP